MAYNKARAEKDSGSNGKKQKKEKLRELGVDEETIQRLHTYDWAQFNKERQYLQRQVEWSPYVDLGFSTGSGTARRGYRIPAGQHRGYGAACIFATQRWTSSPSKSSS